jgi:hypothetical protein
MIRLYIATKIHGCRIAIAETAGTVVEQAQPVEREPSFFS